MVLIIFNLILVSIKSQVNSFFIMHSIETYMFEDFAHVF